MNSDNIIEKALFLQAQNNNNVKLAFDYTGCRDGSINIVFYWFTTKTDKETVELMKQFNFPSNEENFRKIWWDKFVDYCKGSPGSRYFKTLLEDLKIDNSDEESYTARLGKIEICKEKKATPYIIPQKWQKLDDILSKLIRGLYVITFKTKMSNDDTPSDVYEKEFKIKISEKEEKKQTKLRYSEIPPKLTETFVCSAPTKIEHSYSFIKSEVEKFIKTVYLTREAPYNNYEWAYFTLMDGPVKGKFDFDKFWVIIAQKYSSDNAMSKILQYPIKIKAPRTSSGKPLNLKIANYEGQFSFSNNNFIDYEVIRKTNEFKKNLPSNNIKLASTIRSLDDAFCVFGFVAGTLVDINILKNKMFYFNSIYPYAKNIYSIEWNKLIAAAGIINNAIRNNGGSPIEVKPYTCPPGLAINLALPGGESSSESSLEPSIEPPSEPSVDEFVKVKFYDLGFEEYCSVVINPKELIDITEKFINVIRISELSNLLKISNRARSVVKFFGTLDDMTDFGLTTLSRVLDRK